RPRSSRVYGYALSIDLDRVRAARVGLGGLVLDSRAAGRPHGTDAPPTLGVLAALVADMQRNAPAPASAGGVFVGCGVAVSGAIRHHLGWTDATIESVLAAELRDMGRHAPSPGYWDRPPVIGNVADVAALAEHTRGAAVGVDNVLYLHGDAGISAGIIA